MALWLPHNLTTQMKSIRCFFLFVCFLFCKCNTWLQQGTVFSLPVHVAFISYLFSFNAGSNRVVSTVIGHLETVLFCYWISLTLIFIKMSTPTFTFRLRITYVGEWTGPVLAHMLVIVSIYCMHNNTHTNFMPSTLVAGREYRTL